MKQLKILIAALFLISPIAAQADLVALSDLQNQTVEAELFNFDFAGAPLSDGTGGIFTVHGRGDFGDDANEHLDWDIEGILSGTLGQFNIGGTGGLGGPYDSIIEHLADRQYEFFRTYFLSGADLIAITADNLISVTVQLGLGVGVLEPNEFMEVSFEYQSDAVAVPEPGTLALLGLGLAGMGMTRRKKKA